MFLKCSVEKARAEQENPIGRVAVIGAGPAGLAAAGYMVCRGARVVVYDENPEPGGLMIFGIPELRMRKDRVRSSIKELMDAGVSFIQNISVDSALLRKMLREYDAVLVATGTWRTKIPPIENASANGVYGGLEWLVDFNRVSMGYPPRFCREFETPVEPAVVIGGGLTAADAALVLAKVYKVKTSIVYRRRFIDSPMGVREAEKLRSMGVELRELLSPKEIVVGDDGRVCKVVFNRVELGAPDESGRPSVHVIENEFVEVDAKTVILATGLKPTPPESLSELGVLDRRGRVVVDENYMTSVKGLFAAGDVVTGASKIGNAIKTGIEAAEAIIKYLGG